MIPNTEQIRNLLKSKVWIVAKNINNKTYFVSDITNIGTIMWTQNRKIAVGFKTNDGIKQFLNQNLNNRTDVYLIRSSSHALGK